MNKFFKLLAYLFGIILTIIILLLAGLTVYDFLQQKRFESKITQVRVGDTKEMVMQIMGKPNYIWNKADPKSGICGKPGSRANSGVAYGGIMDWRNAFFSEFPFFYPFRFRLFSPDDDDIVICLDDKNVVSYIRIPK